MDLVHTTKGLIERDRLIVTDTVSEEPDKRVVVTTWRLDGEIVKQDVWASILRGESVFGEQAEI